MSNDFLGKLLESTKLKSNTPIMKIYNMDRLYVVR